MDYSSSPPIPVCYCGQGISTNNCVHTRFLLQYPNKFEDPEG